MKEVEKVEKFNFGALAVFLLIVQLASYYSIYSNDSIEFTSDVTNNVAILIGYNIWLISAIICLIVHFNKKYKKTKTIKDNYDFKQEKIESKTNSKKNINISKKHVSIDHKLIYIIVISITIIVSVGIFSFSNYQKEKLKQNEENERLEKEQKALEQQKNNLNNCINQAKNSRTNLWNSNCIKQSDGSCTISSKSGVSEWIEQRYQQDLNNCYQLYGN